MPVANVTIKHKLVYHYSYIIIKGINLNVIHGKAVNINLFKIVCAGYNEFVFAAPGAHF